MHPTVNTKSRMNKKENGDTGATKRRVSRARYECPQQLKEMLDLIRLVPPNTFLFNLVEMYEKNIAEEQEKGELIPFIFGNTRSAYLENVFRQVFPDRSPLAALQRYLEHTPEEFQDFIMRPPEYLAYLTLGKDMMGDDVLGPDELCPAEPAELTESDKFNWAMSKYTSFHTIRESLQALVRHLDSERKIKLAARGTGYLSLGWFPLTLTTTIERGSDGKLRTTGLASLLGTFDDSRLRTCQICEHIFWAKRKDSKTCGRRCLNVFNVREYRALTSEEKAERKARRKANQRMIKNGTVKQTKRSK